MKMLLSYFLLLNLIGCGLDTQIRTYTAGSNPVDPNPTEEPTAEPTEEPTAEPTEEPTAEPTEEPTAEPTDVPTSIPTDVPTSIPTDVPTSIPTDVPTSIPTDVPTSIPTDVPTSIPTDVPTSIPTDVPTSIPTEVPTSTPSPTPSPTPDQNVACLQGQTYLISPGISNGGAVNLTQAYDLSASTPVVWGGKTWHVLNESLQYFSYDSQSDSVSIERANKSQCTTLYTDVDGDLSEINFQMESTPHWLPGTTIQTYLVNDAKTAYLSCVNHLSVFYPQQNSSSWNITGRSCDFENTDYQYSNVIGPTGNVGGNASIYPRIANGLVDQNHFKCNGFIDTPELNGNGEFRNQTLRQAEGTRIVLRVCLDPSSNPVSRLKISNYSIVN